MTNTLRLITEPDLPPGHHGHKPNTVAKGITDYSDWLNPTPKCLSPSKPNGWKGKGDLEIQRKGWSSFAIKSGWTWGWRDGSVVQSTCCSSRGPLGSVPRIRIRRVTATYYSSSWRFNFSAFSGHLDSCTQTHTETYTNT